MLTITFRRLKRDRRGVSNIVVVALSLVIVLAIVSNIILWNYEMTQLDYEKMKEETSITNVQAVTEYSPWFVAQSEFSVTSGSYVDGKYVDTHKVDDSFEIFVEGSSGTEETVLIKGESFEGTWRPYGWDSTGDWRKGDVAYDQKYSAYFEGWSGGGGSGRSGYLISPVMDCSGADAIYVDFWWYDLKLEDDDLLLQFFDGTSWNTYQDLNQIKFGNDNWNHYTTTIKDAHYFIKNFQIRWWAHGLVKDKTACVDLVTVSMSGGSGSYSLELDAPFNVDLSEYPRENIQTVEIQLRYRANDAEERWYLKAYNWKTLEYSDVGFNNTWGHLPTTDWDVYSVSLLGSWENYVHSNGTIRVQFVDQDWVDLEPTRIEIDFLGVNVQMDGTEFTFENVGGFTVHVVSLWVIDETSHQRYDINVFVNSAATKNHVLFGVMLPEESYTIKAVTERGNVAVFSSN